MFSNFGNLFITGPRRAEGTDARLDIRRHEPEQEDRRKKGEQQDPAAMFDTDDSATVTVDALRAFLENFLKTLEAEKSDTPKIRAAVSQAPQDSAEQTPPRHVDGVAAQAAGVYKHVAQKVDRTAATVVSDESAAPILGSADIRVIHQLIEDLKPVAERGIEYLTIERSDSFLNSLVNAVNKAKNP